MAKKLEWKVSFQRSGSFPLDVDSVFSTLDDAKNYALTGVSAHVGQSIAVTGETGSTLYKIDKTGSDYKLTEIPCDVYKKDEVDTLIGNAGKVKDVKVNGSTVVNTDGVANITIPSVDSDLNTNSYNAIANAAVASKFGDYYTKSEVVSHINSAVSNVEIFEFVTVLPTENIRSNKIYVVPGNNAEIDDENVCVEYIWHEESEVWEQIGRIKIDNSINIDDYYTKDEIDGKLVFDTTFSSNSTNAVQNKVITKELNDIRQEISAATGTDLTVFAKKTDIATINNQNVTSGGNIEVGTIRNVVVKTGSTTSESVVNGVTATIDLSSLIARIADLEAELKSFKDVAITTSNISEHAVTNISTKSGDEDIIITGTKGGVTIELNSITNIAFDDAK